MNIISGQFLTGCRPQVRLSFVQVTAKCLLRCLRMAELYILDNVCTLIDNLTVTARCGMVRWFHARRNKPAAWPKNNVPTINPLMPTVVIWVQL